MEQPTATLSRRLWLLMTLFILYGGTIPFNFKIDHDILTLKLARAVADAPFSLAALHRLSLTDVVQNVLLFLPFGALGVWAGGKAPRSIVRRVVFITVLGALLATVVEILQLFTLDRITSVSDVIADALGALFGAVGAFVVKESWLRQLKFLKRAGLLDAELFYPFVVAVIAICISMWEPFDVTLDVGTVFHKVRLLQRDVWQYSGLNDEGIGFVQYALLVGATCAWLRALGVRAAAMWAAVVGVSAAFVLEASQFAISARMPGLEDAVVHSCGALAGAALCGININRAGRGWWLGWLVAGTAAGAAMDMLSPFQVAPHYSHFQWVPFLNYWTNTTFDTVSHFVELLLIYFPLGFSFRYASAKPARAVTVALVVAFAIAAPLEYLQGWVIGRYADATDIFVSVLGAWVGTWMASRGAVMFADTVRALDGSSDDKARARTPSRGPAAVPAR